MPRPLAIISSYVTGDPVLLGADVTTLDALVRALSVEDPEPPGALQLVPNVTLVHSLTGSQGLLAVRWVQVPHAPSLGSAEPAEIVVVVTAPIPEAQRALRLVSRLRACLRDPSVLARARSARRREELVRVLGAAEPTAGESALSATEVAQLLDSWPQGLAGMEAKRRREICGPNRIERVRRRPLAARLAREFTSFFAVLLWIAGALALVAGMPQLGWAIFAVIVVNGVFSFLQEYRAERAVEMLQELLPHEIGVLRDGAETRVRAEDLVPGDWVLVEEGDRIPADGQLVNAQGLRVDQGPLTGESHSVFKLPAAAGERERVPLEDRHEWVFAGTNVMVGVGTFIATATGMGTEIGRIADLTQAVTEEASPLQRQMARVTRIVTMLAIAFGGGAFVLGLASGVFQLSEGFLFAIGVIVANVPEGLLPTLTLALALGVQRMAAQRSLVKRLSAVDALGAVTVICTDKTGTLTEGRMSVRFVWAGGRALAPDARKGEPPVEVRRLLEAATLGSQATLEHGDPTERALVTAAVRSGIVPEALRTSRPLLVPHPFDSFRRRMSLVRRTPRGPVAYVKGAPKEILALCRTVLWADGTRPLADGLRAEVLAQQDRLAEQGLRLLAVAERRLPDRLVSAAAADVERDLTFLGLLALWDPPRPEVKDAVAMSRRSGIRVIMITGDYGLTAQAVAREVGLPSEKVVTGEELERLPEESLRRLVTEPGVLFARASPAHKLGVVRALRELGETVAVTGDGVNDAPALKAADVGVAMGERGSEVAKEAAEVIVTDDNFASIVTAVRQGRAIYDNMGKFVTYIFASNVPEVVPFLAFVFLGIPLPLTIMQILAVDLGTDLLPALALGAEPPEPDVMDRPPRRRRQPLLSAARLWRAYAFLGVIEAALSLLGFFWVYWLAGWRPGLALAATGELYRRATTMTLAGIVALQVGNVLACRSEQESVFRIGVFRNRLVWLGIAAEIGLLLALIATPPLARVFGLAPLGLSEWAILPAFPVVLLASDEARKWIVRRGARASREARGGHVRRRPAAR